MFDSRVTRREFSRLTAAALGGLTFGVSHVIAQSGTAQDSELLKEPHVCRGLNTCKGIGAKKDNACAGMGQCTTAKAHDCKGMNDCKGQGGCGQHAGENACKGMGECGVPLKDKTWAVARKNFETAMTKAGKKFGDAPKK